MLYPELFKKLITLKKDIIFTIFYILGYADPKLNF